MGRQLRIIIGDNNGNFASNLAAALHCAGDWVILRHQQFDLLMDAVRTEHPDVLVLDIGESTTRFPELTERILAFSDVTILAFYEKRDPSLEEAFNRIGVRYLPKSDLVADRVRYVHMICGRYPMIRQNQQQPIQQNELSVTRLLNDFGISTNLRGYHYLRAAILTACECQTCSGCMMNVIYPSVAEQMHSTPSRVERAIRHAILQAWEHGGPRIGWQYGLNIDHRMTNSEFISFAVEWLHSEQMSRSLIAK